MSLKINKREVGREEQLFASKSSTVLKRAKPHVMIKYTCQNHHTSKLNISTVFSC